MQFLLRIHCNRHYIQYCHRQRLNNPNVVDGKVSFTCSVLFLRFQILYVRWVQWIFSLKTFTSIVPFFLHLSGTTKRRNRYFPAQMIRYCLITYRAGAWHYRIFPDFLKSPVSKWRIVGVKTRAKAFFFEEILINIPSENLSKLSNEGMQYFCHTLKL